MHIQGVWRGGGSNATLNILKYLLFSSTLDFRFLRIQNSVYSYSRVTTECLNYNKLECVNQNWTVNLFTIYFKLIKGHVLRRALHLSRHNCPSTCPPFVSTHRRVRHSSHCPEHASRQDAHFSVHSRCFSLAIQVICWDQVTYKRK